ncbi:MAG: hypothetical protein HY675_10300 [Chloroflexi bacterium]|nr:hypothetical protein [Chloroflexota bacterium]
MNGRTADVIRRPLHPYTRALLDSVARPGSKGTWLRTIDGQPPDPVNLPPCCSFATRCSRAEDRCARRKCMRDSRMPEPHPAPGRTADVCP